MGDGSSSSNGCYAAATSAKPTQPANGHTTRRRRTRIERDTVVDVRVEKEVVQLPPERYVPKFYRWCTAALWAIGLLVMGYWLLKWWLKCRV